MWKPRKEHSRHRAVQCKGPGWEGTWVFPGTGSQGLVCERDSRCPEVGRQRTDYRTPEFCSTCNESFGGFKKRRDMLLFECLKTALAAGWELNEKAAVQVTGR